jgi:hypothetical protein
MIDGTYIKILEHLSKRSINQKIDVGAFIKPRLKKGKTLMEAGQEVINPVSIIKQFLSDMEKNDHINYTKIPCENDHPNAIWASITINGMNYLLDFN